MDDSASNTTGPIPDWYVFNPGTLNLTLTNVIFTTTCPTMATPATVSTTMTVYYQNVSLDKNSGLCSIAPAGNPPGQHDAQSKVGDPCDISTGNNYQKETDYQSSTLPLVRHYNSLFTANEGLGMGWTMAYYRRLELFGHSMRVRRADGRSEPFTLTGGVWQGDPDSALSVTQDATGFTVIVENGDAERYNLTGTIQWVQSPQNQTWTWAYSPQMACCRV